MSLYRQWRAGVDEVTSRRMNTRSMPVFSTAADMVAANARFTGQIAFCLENGLFYRYDGSAWVAFQAGGGGYITFGVDTLPAKSHEARYFSQAIQAIPNVTDTKVQFPLVFANASNDVVASGSGNTDFLLTRAGWWHIAANLIFATAAAGLERHLFLQTGSSFAAANRFAFSTESNAGTGVIALSCSTSLRVAANTTIICGAFQNSGASVNTDPRDANSVHGAVNIEFVWLRP